MNGNEHPMKESMQHPFAGEIQMDADR